MASKLEAFNAYELPVRRENEALIISNAIQDSKNREMFIKKVMYSDFRMPEFNTIAWAIKQNSDIGMSVSVDSVLLRSSQAPIKYPVTAQILNDLIANFKVVTPSDYEKYIKELKLDSIKAKIIDSTFSHLYKICLDPAADLGEVEKRIEYIRGVIKTGYSSSILEFKSMDEVVDNYILNFGKKSNFRPTGFKELDEEMNEGLRGGAITIVAGLAHMGKSSFTLSMMKNLANKKVPTAQFALEMNTMSLTTKLLSFNSQIPISFLTKDLEKLNDQLKELREFELKRLSRNKYLWLDDNPARSLSQIREQTMMLQDRVYPNGGDGYIVIPIDLFGKIKDFASSDNFARDYENKLNEVQVMTRELGVHYVLVAQINREVGKGKLKRPKMANLKNAGAFEEVADNIFAVHRPYYDSDKALKEEFKKKSVFQEEEDGESVDELEKCLAEILILKQRMGANNKIVNFYMDPNTTRFQPWATLDQELLNRAKHIELNRGEDD